MKFLKSLFKTNQDLANGFDSPTFVGSRADFNKYFGPRLRNLVQYISRNHKNSVGKCQHCGVVKSKGLDAAHVHGKERMTLIKETLENFVYNDFYKVDLYSFEQQFIELHNPIKEVILVLCKECHVKYDSTVQSGRLSNSLEVIKPNYKSNTQNYIRPPREGGKFNNKEIQVKITEAALKIPLEELDRLCDSAYSKNTFDNNYAIFVRVPSKTIKEIKQKVIRDHTDIARWTWKYEFERNGYSYAVSTQWYNRNDDSVQKWLRKFLYS
mgnify:CR=1 FL=1|tara:strand:- start:10 stop:813 length:804 start_codon:yes stop_codon:yes gene_type:complete